MPTPPSSEPTPPFDAPPLYPTMSRPKARLVLATAFAALGVWVAWGFLVPLGWSVVLGIAIVARAPLRWPEFLTPLLFTLAVAVVIVVPVGVGAVQLGREGQA